MQRAPNQPTSDLTLFAGIFLKIYSVREANTLMAQHSHEHPHITLLIRGSVRVESGDGLRGEFTAPATLKIPARVLHSFTTLTDDCVFACIHATETEPPIHEAASIELDPE